VIRGFLAKEHGTGRKVVVKVPPTEPQATVSIERFRSELLRVSGLEHPHIVPVLTAGGSGELLYYTTSFVPGETLLARLAREGSLPVPEAVRLLREILDALGYAHAKGVVHREMKPTNVLLFDGHALVADFGVAKALSDAASAMVPPPVEPASGPSAPASEQATRSADYQADLHAVAALGYEMLTGQTPVPIPSATGAFRRKWKQPNIGRLRPDCPPGVGAVIMRWLAKEPSERPQSAERALRELDGAWRESRVLLPASRSSQSPKAPRLLPSPPWEEWHRWRPVNWRPQRWAVAAGMIAVGAALVFIRIHERSVRRRGETPAAARSIAVLPFIDQSKERENGYFSDAITEDLIDALGRMQGLRVAGRTSSFAFKGKASEPREIGQALHATVLLKGTVQRSGAALQMTVTLLDAGDGQKIWAGTYYRKLRDIFAVEDEIARGVAAALQLKLPEEPAAALAKPLTADSQAYQRYSEGRQALRQGSRTQLLQGTSYLKQAVSRDPKFAQAYAGLADAYLLLPEYAVLRPAEAWSQARVTAGRALALDSSLAEAHATLAEGANRYDYHWAAAEKGYLRALAVDANSSPTLQRYGDFLAARGRFQEALLLSRRAFEVDPLSAAIGSHLARVLYQMRQFDDAFAVFRRVLELDPNLPMALTGIGRIHLHDGRRNAALATMQLAVNVSGRLPYHVGNLAYAFGRVGDTTEAKRLIAELRQRSREEYVPPSALAIAYMGLGDLDQAFQYVQAAVRERDPWFAAESLVSPIYEPLWADPRSVLIRRRMGIWITLGDLHPSP